MVLLWWLRIESGYEHEINEDKSGATKELTDLYIDLRGLASHRLEHSIRTKGIKVGPGVIERTLVCDGSEVKIRMKAKLPCQGLEDLKLRVVSIADP